VDESGVWSVLRYWLGIFWKDWGRRGKIWQDSWYSTVIRTRYLLNTVRWVGRPDFDTRRYFLQTGSETHEALSLNGIGDYLPGAKQLRLRKLRIQGALPPRLVFGCRTQFSFPRDMQRRVTYCNMTPESRYSSLLGNGLVNTFLPKRTCSKIE
jgi:hypothetical protein